MSILVLFLGGAGEKTTVTPNLPSTRTPHSRFSKMSFCARKKGFGKRHVQVGAKNKDRVRVGMAQRQADRERREGPVGNRERYRERGRVGRGYGLWQVERSKFSVVVITIRVYVLYSVLVDHSS